MPSKSCAYFFFLECNLFETFLIVVSSRLILPRKHALKIFFPCWKEGWTWISFCLLAGFQAQQLENLHRPFLFPERCSVQWGRPFFPGVQRCIPSQDLSWARPWVWSGPSPVAAHTFGALQCAFPRMLLLVTAVEISWADTPSLFPFSFFFFKLMLSNSAFLL